MPKKISAGSSLQPGAREKETEGPRPRKVLQELGVRVDHPIGDEADDRRHNGAVPRRQDPALEEGWRAGDVTARRNHHTSVLPAETTRVYIFLFSNGFQKQYCT